MTGLCLHSSWLRPRSHVPATSCSIQTRPAQATFLLHHSNTRQSPIYLRPPPPLPILSSSHPIFLNLDTLIHPFYLRYSNHLHTSSSQVKMAKAAASTISKAKATKTKVKKSASSSDEMPKTATKSKAKTRDTGKKAKKGASILNSKARDGLLTSRRPQRTQARSLSLHVLRQ